MKVSIAVQRHGSRRSSAAQAADLKPLNSDTEPDRIDWSQLTAKFGPFPEDAGWNQCRRRLQDAHERILAPPRRRLPELRQEGRRAGRLPSRPERGRSARSAFDCRNHDHARRERPARLASDQRQSGARNGRSQGRRNSGRECERRRHCDGASTTSETSSGTTVSGSPNGSSPTARKAANWR